MPHLASILNRLKRHPLAVLVALAVFLRLAAALAMGNVVESLPGIDDQRSYHMLAQRVLQGSGFTVAADWWPLTQAGAPTAHWSYLYTLYLTAVYALLGLNPLVARLLQALVVGALWPLLSYRIARRLAGERVALIAAAWSALYGYFIYYSAALMTEPFYITAVLWSLDLALGLAPANTGTRLAPTVGAGSSRPPGSSRPLRWLLLGLAVGIAVLLRQSYLLFLPFLFLWLFLALRPRLALTAIIRRGALALAVLALLILPWTVRNYLAFDRFVLLNTNSGYAFFWANHPIYGTDFQGILPAGTSYQSLVPQELRHLDEAALDSALLKEGLRFVREDPGRYLLLSLSRLETYFMFWPSGESSGLSNAVRVLSFGVTLPFMLWGLLVSRRRWRNWSLLYLFALVYTGIHLLSWALIRYRLPVDAVLLTFAGLGLADLAERLAARPRVAAALGKVARAW